MRSISAIYLLILILSISTSAQTEKIPCPTIQIIEPSSITNPGENIAFSVNIEPEKVSSKLKYQWSVSAGTIIEGQDNPAIKIATTPEMNGSTITAKVKIQGLPDECSNEFSGVAYIAALATLEPVDAYGKVSRNEDAGRLDNLFFQLMGNPKALAFILISSGEGVTSKQVKRRIKEIVNHANFRKFPKQRLIFAIENSKQQRTVVFILLKENDFPKCENCEIIRGADVQ